MDETIVMVPPPVDALRAWPIVKEYVERALVFSQGEVTIDDIRDGLGAGKFQLWIVWHGTEKRILAVATTQVVQYPRHQALLIVTISGAKMDSWSRALHERLVTFCKERGISRMEAVGRRGLERKLAPLGFRQVYVVFSVEV